jgi:hypothetical protein
VGAPGRDRSARPDGEAQAGAGYSQKKLTGLIGWHKGEADAKKLEEAGFDDLRGDAPTLCPAAEQALHCWNFCGGWSPALWPAYAAFHDVDDWHLLVELMQVIRKHV